jgi:hypothetical protein
MTAVLGAEEIRLTTRTPPVRATSRTAAVRARPSRRRLTEEERVFARLLLEFLWEFEAVGPRTVVPATAGQWAMAGAAGPGTEDAGHQGQTPAPTVAEGGEVAPARRPLRVPPFVAALSEL